MQKVIVHRAGAASTGAAGTDRNPSLPTIKLGLDIHQACYVVAAQEDHATPKPARRFHPAEFVPWVETLLARGHRVFVVYEACGFGFGLCRRLTARGAVCYVIAPRKLDEARKGVKTDPLDAGVLCQRLSRYVEGNRKELAVLRVPTEEEEQLRHIHRQREALVRARTKLQAQGRCLLLNHGEIAPQRWWRRQGWQALEARLPGWLLARLGVFRPVLETLDTQIAALTVELEKAAPQSVPAGLGRLTAVIVTREVCDWHRFKNRRQVSSYTGLCPGEYSSGGKRMPGAVTKHGNPRLRAALVELAWRLVRFQPQYPPVQKRLAVLAKGARATGAARKKAIVAVARQLAVDLWRWQTGQCSAEQLGLEPASTPMTHTNDEP
jgi:transposase